MSSKCAAKFVWQTPYLDIIEHLRLQQANNSRQEGSGTLHKL